MMLIRQMIREVMRSPRYQNRHYFADTRFSTKNARRNAELHDAFARQEFAVRMWRIEQERKKQRLYYLFVLMVVTALIISLAVHSR